MSPTYKPQGPTNTSSSSQNPEPSYHGPSAAWEKDESFPSSETPMPPSEEEKDVLEN